jgi:uncharacterized delta-60 repeat protein
MKKHCKHILLLIGAFLISASCQTALAAAGDLDLSFGIGGKVTTDFIGSDDSVHALVRQPDGKLVAAGSTSTSSNTDFALARYHPDGSLDSSFGIGGKATTDFAGGFDSASALVLQPDGKLVAAGSSSTGANGVFALARYHSDGSLDSSFGSGGKVTTVFAGGVDSASALVLQPDGKLVVAGFTTGGGGADCALARYNSDGSLDSSFGSGGKVTTNFVAGGTCLAYALVLQPDGKLVSAGWAYTGGLGTDFALVRYNADGSLDSSFGSGGKVATNFYKGFSEESSDEAHALVLQPDGKLVAAGSINLDLDYHFGLARYNSDGSLDSGFGIGGKVITNPGGFFEQVSALVLQPDGKLVAAGIAAGGTDFQLVRYNSDGGLDTSFGGGGKVTTDFSGNFDWAYALVLQPDGKLVAAGYAVHSDIVTNADFALARYIGTTSTTNQPPVANAGSYPAKQCTSHTGTLVSLDGSASYDPDGEPIISYSWAGPFGTATGVNPAVLLPLGSNNISLTVADASAPSMPALTQVTVVDTIPPTITSVSASPAKLWQPHHKLVPVTVSVSASDVCSATTTCKIVSVKSNEPVNGKGDDDTAPDWKITGNLSVNLRAERSGSGNERIYTITVECKDASGNKSSKPVTVTVPHSRKTDRRSPDDENEKRH